MRGGGGVRYKLDRQRVDLLQKQLCVFVFTAIFADILFQHVPLSIILVHDYVDSSVDSRCCMLTNTTAKAIKPGDSPISDRGVKGLRLHPHKTIKGRGAWKLRFTSPVTQKRRDIGLGTYPEVSIADARGAATAAHRLIASGQDPIMARDAAAAAVETPAPTFEEAARRRYAEVKPGFANPKHVAQWISTLETYVFPAIGHRPVDDLKVRDFADVLRPIWLAKPETAQRVKQRCQDVMDWAYSQDMTPGNPVASVRQLLPKQPAKSKRVVHHPALPWRQIPDFYAARLADARNSTQALMSFVIMTAARSGEARHAYWSEVDLDGAIWTVPAARMKTGLGHRVPLSSTALALLRKLPSQKAGGLVFPAPRGGVLTDMALTKFLRDHRVPSDTSGRHATAHGFRSAFRDWASENGYARDLAERALAHTVKNATEAAYHRTDLVEQRRPMMEAWGAHICSALALQKD